MSQSGSPDEEETELLESTAATLKKSTDGDYKPFSKMIRPELRLYIASKTGSKTRADTALDISTLNSVAAWLTGTFAVDPMRLSRTGSPGAPPIRREVATVVRDRGQEQDFDCGRMDDYLPGPDETDGTTDYGEKGFRLDELRAIACCLARSEDQREWT